MSSYCPEVRPSDWSKSEPDWNWCRSNSGNEEYLNRLELIDHLIAKAVEGAQTSAASSIEVRFRELADKWARDTSHVSSITKKVLHPNYQTIMSMGPVVVSLMIQDLSDNRRDWFWALQHITQANPVSPKDAGHLDKMIAAWVKWGKERMLL